MDGYNVEDIRKALESIFETEHAQDVAHNVLTLLQIERLLKNVGDKNRKKVLIALCKQYGISASKE